MTEEQQAESAAAAEVAKGPVVPEKFRNTDGSLNQTAMLASYAELEGKLGNPEKAAVADGDSSDENDSVANPDADADKTQDEGADDGAGEHVYSTVIDAAMVEADLAPADVAAEWAEKGELTEETRGKLDASFGKDAVEMYIEGWKSKQGAAAENAPAADDADGGETERAGPTPEEQVVLTAELGGEEAYKELVTWGAENLTDAEIERFNTQVNTDVNAARMSLDWLKSRRETVEGAPPKVILKGDQKGAAASDVYASMQEVTRDMSARDANGRVMYKEDQAYRDRVKAKLGRSDV